MLLVSLLVLLLVVFVAYLPGPASLLWVIGAVIGGLFGIFLIVWCFLYIYCKFRQMPQHTVKLSVHPEIVSMEIADSETMTKKIADCETSRDDTVSKRKTNKQVEKILINVLQVN